MTPNGSGSRSTAGLPGGFIPCGPPTSASSRLQVYLPQQWLAEQEPGQWHILQHPDCHRRGLKRRQAVRIYFEVLRQRIRTVIFQKVHKDRAPALMAALRFAGRRIIYVECDEREDLRFARHVDHFVAPSDQLADYLTRRTSVPVSVIPDPIEYHAAEALQKPWQAKPPYRTLWIGSARNWHQLADLKALLAANDIGDFAITAISDHPDAEIRWSLDHVREQLAQADLGIIPLTEDSWSTMKSHNRATLFMSSGVPVVVSNGPVYRGLVRDGETGFVYSTADELKSVVRRLSDASLVEAIRQRAMAAAEAYSIDRVASQWRELVTQGALSGHPQER